MKIFKLDCRRLQLYFEYKGVGMIRAEIGLKIDKL
jgi:hypothetical protein